MPVTGNGSLLYLRFIALSYPADISRLPWLREHWKPSSHLQAQQRPLSHLWLPMHGTGPITSELRTAPCSGLFKYVNCCLYSYFLTVVPIHLYVSHCFYHCSMVIPLLHLCYSSSQVLVAKEDRKIWNVCITTRQKSQYFRQICCWSFQFWQKKAWIFLSFARTHEKQSGNQGVFPQGTSSNPVW